MSIRMISIVTGVIGVGAASASADVLWDQSAYDAGAPGFFNTVSGGPPFGQTVYTVNDVTVGDPEGWEVDSITIFVNSLGGGITAASSGVLHVFSGSDPLPGVGDDPTASPSVAISVALVDAPTDTYSITASGLDLDLAAGDYWIGITPIAPAGPFGSAIHLSATSLVGDASASYDAFPFPAPPGGPAWFNFNPGVDASLLIEGAVAPAPGALGALCIAGLTLTRRRR